MVLLLCYSYHLGLLCVRTAQIHLSYTCGTTCNPQKLDTQNDGVEKNTSSFLNPYTQYPCIISAERFFAFYVCKVDYSSNYVIVITFTSYKKFLSPISLKSSPWKGRLQKNVTPRKTDADCCVDQTHDFYFTHTRCTAASIVPSAYIYICICIYVYITTSKKRLRWYRGFRRNSSLQAAWDTSIARSSEFEWHHQECESFDFISTY